MPTSFRHVRVGDTVLRMLGGTITMHLEVLKVDESLIYCGAPNEAGWMFDRETGVEVDHDLRWGPEYGESGSYLHRNGNAN